MATNLGGPSPLRLEEAKGPAPGPQRLQREAAPPTARAQRSGFRMRERMNSCWVGLPRLWSSVPAATGNHYES